VLLLQLLPNLLLLWFDSINHRFLAVCCGLWLCKQGATLHALSVIAMMRVG
jgi:hypothetical protein